VEWDVKPLLNQSSTYDRCIVPSYRILASTQYLGCIECMRCRLLLPMFAVSVCLSVHRFVALLKSAASRAVYAAYHVHGVIQCSLCQITFFPKLITSFRKPWRYVQLTNILANIFLKVRLATVQAKLTTRLLVVDSSPNKLVRVNVRIRTEGRVQIRVTARVRLALMRVDWKPCNTVVIL